MSQNHAKNNIVNNQYSARKAAVICLSQVIIENKSLSFCFNEQFLKISNEQDRGLYHQIVYGCLRYYPSILKTFSTHLNKPISDKNSLLNILLASAIYQLVFLNTPEYAVINESVKLAKIFNVPWASGLINAVLRKFITTGSKFIVDACLDQPIWFFSAIKQQYPDNYLNICKYNHENPPIILRTHDVTRTEYLNLLTDIGITGYAHDDAKEAIVLEKAGDISSLPLFKDGKVTIQDANAQLAANILKTKDNLRILDACAAPGGKTAHIYSKIKNLNNVELFALDNSPARVIKLQETFARLNVQAKLITDELQNLQSWYDGKPFDRILLDAPCSATGVIRRHPDILYLRKKQDIDEIILLQQQLLEICWQILAKEGRIVYVTCSILAGENHMQINKFLSKHDNAKLVPLAHNRSINNSENENMLQFLADDFGDGFFYAALEKI